MPNTGKPSKDCHLCRKRRVKCDLGQPECQRCLRLGKKCPGYRDEIDLMFRNEDVSTYESSSGRDRRRTRADNSKANHRLSASPPITSLNFPVQNLSSRRFLDRSTRLSHGIWQFETPLSEFDRLILSTSRSGLPPLEMWENIAIPLTLCLFSGSLGDSRDFGHMDFLPSMLIETREDSPLILSCRALALAYLSNKSGTDELKALRTEAYGRALSATNLLLCNVDLCKEDEACVCVWLLSIYEVIVGSPKSNRIPGPVTWSIHTQGLVELLRMRGPEQLQRQRTRDIFWELTHSIQNRALMAGIECPTFLPEWLTEYEDDVPEIEQDYRLLYLFGCDAASFSAVIRNAMDTGSNVLLSPGSDIFEAAERLDNRVTAILANDPLQTPISFHQVSVHNTYRSTHIKVQSALLQLLDSPLVSGFSPQGTIPILRKQYLQVLRDLTDATLETIPYVIGTDMSDSPASSPSQSRSPNLARPRAWADALNAVWPLRQIISSSSFVRIKQQELAENYLRRIATESYIRQAVGAFFTEATYKLTQSFGQAQSAIAVQAPILIRPDPRQMIAGNRQHRTFGQREKSVQSCITCETRKVVCDGERPSCMRCQSQGYTCHGYAEVYESIIPFRFSSDTHSSSSSVNDHFD